MPGKRNWKRERSARKKAFQSERDCAEHRQPKNEGQDYHHRPGKDGPSPSNHQTHSSNWRHRAPKWNRYKNSMGGEANTFNQDKETEETPGTSQRSHRSTSDELEIPGFYYDKEKKRYFKIAPNHCTNLVTKETINKKMTEEKRQDDLKQLLHRPQKKKLQIQNLVPSLSLRSAGLSSSDTMASNLTRACVSNLKPTGSQYLFDVEALGMHENLEHMHIMKATTNCEEILGLWSLNNTWVQRIQLLKLSEVKRQTEKQAFSLQAKPHQRVVVQSFNKVTDMCWAPTQGSERHILYTTICHTGHLFSLAMIRNMAATTDNNSQLTVFDYNLGRKASWACAWNQHTRRFSVGSEKSSLVLDVESRRLWEYHTNGSDPLSQTFSHQNGQLLYNGTRKGEILTHDLRSQSTRPVSCMKHRSSVCGIHLLQDDTRMVAGDFTGRLCLWDIRKKDVVVEYLQGFNQYTRIPVHVDQGETTVYGVGQDGYTRFWSLRQGTLLHSIPPPRPVTRETIPTVHFSMNWANKPGNAGLVMGLENNLYYYGKIPLS